MKFPTALTGVAVLVLGVLFTAWAVGQSGRYGRLSSVPTYDDAVYFASGTRLLAAFRADGVSGVAGVLRERGMHSPWSEGLAAAAFATLGNRDDAPYVFNGIVIAVYLGGLAYILRGISFGGRFAALVLYLTLPFATLAVVEFRPDLVWAVLVGFGAVYGIIRDRYFASVGPAMIHGAIGGLALLVKPSTFVMTLIVFGFSFAARVVIEMVAEKRLPWGAAVRAAAAFTAAVVVVAGVFFVPFGAKTLAYFWVNSFGENREIWAFRGDAVARLLFYLTGDGGVNNLGWPGVIVVGVFLAGLVGAAFSREPVRIVRAGLLVGLVVMVFAINTLAQMKSPFLGGAIYGCAIFGSAVLLAELVGNARRHWPPTIVTGGMWGLALLGIGLAEWPPHATVPAERANFAKAQAGVVSALASFKLREKPVIAFTQSGPVVPENIEVWLLRRGVPVRARNWQFVRDEKTFAENLRGVDLVLLQDAGTPGAFTNLPSESLLNRFREIVATDDRFRLTATVPVNGGKNVYVYGRERKN